MEALAAGILISVCVFFIVYVVMGILFLMTLQRLLGRCQERNRDMQPGLVWLNLVPCLNLVWNFLTVIWISSSLQKEFATRGLQRPGDYGKTVGILALVANIGASVLSRVVQAAGEIGKEPMLLIAGASIAIVGVVVFFCLWIYYWIKMAGYSQELLEDNLHRREYEPPGQDRDNIDDEWHSSNR